MGTNNRSRRAAKKVKHDKKRRPSAHRRPEFADAPETVFGPHGPGCTCPWPDGTEEDDPSGDVETIEAVFARAVSVAQRDERATMVLLESLNADYPQREVDIAVDRQLIRGLRRAWESGWQPCDIVEYMHRRAGEPEVALVTDAIASETSQYAPATIDGRWSEQLDQIGADPWWPEDRPWLSAWAERYVTDTVFVWRAAAIVVGIIEVLAPLNVTLPLPGSPSARATARSGDVDEKVLARVRALLAKAESTEFPDEAEALSAKAQQLMTKFSLDRVLVEAAGESPEAGVAERRLWLDKPYVSAKAMLVTMVAQVNRCRSILLNKIGFMSVVGDPTDVGLVEVLTTSLLVQANRAMLAHGTQRSAWGQSRTRSYRQSFLVSYAQRIGERLENGVAAAHQEVGDDDRLLPALAARDARVEDKFADLYPETRGVRVSASNRAGWEDGRVAADMANLDVRRAVKHA